MSIDREQRIRELAHKIWESEGCPQGQATRHWAMAERLYAASEPRQAASPAKPRSTKARRAPKPLTTTPSNQGKGS